MAETMMKESWAKAFRKLDSGIGDWSLSAGGAHLAAANTEKFTVSKARKSLAKRQISCCPFNKSGKVKK